VEAAARAVGQQIDFLRAGNERDIDGLPHHGWAANGRMTRFCSPGGSS
jgi:hypothetical protein